MAKCLEIMLERGRMYVLMFVYMIDVYIAAWWLQVNIENSQCIHIMHCDIRTYIEYCTVVQCSPSVPFGLPFPPSGASTGC